MVCSSTKHIPRARKRSRKPEVLASQLQGEGLQRQWKQTMIIDYPHQSPRPPKRTRRLITVWTRRPVCNERTVLFIMKPLPIIAPEIAFLLSCPSDGPGLTSHRAVYVRVRIPVIRHVARDGNGDYFPSRRSGVPRRVCDRMSYNDADVRTIRGERLIYTVCCVIVRSYDCCNRLPFDLHWNICTKLPGRPHTV